MFELAVIEQAKGVLMLRYGIGSYEALAVLGRWSRETGSSLDDTARVLTSSICQGRSTTAAHQEFLARWLEQRLREDLPEARRVQWEVSAHV